MKSSNVLLGIVAGTAVGAAIGVLFAPDKGSNTRKKFASKSEDFVGGIKEKAIHMVDAVKTPFHAEMHEGNGKSTMSKAKLTEMK